MKGNIGIEVFGSFFTATEHEEVLSLSFRNSMFEDMIDLNKRDVILDYLDRILGCEAIKAVVINSSSETSGTDECLEFFVEAGCEKAVPSFWGTTGKTEKYTIARFCNVINQVILKIVGLNKIVVHACQGHLTSVLLSLSLACDYRIATDDTVFHNTYLDLGMLPQGGVPFFLSRMLGPGKAYEILLLQKKISAQEAMKFGIVDQAVPVERLEETAIEIAHRFGRQQISSISGVKRLVNYSMRDLENYLEFEKGETLNLVDSVEFGRRMQAMGLNPRESMPNEVAKDGSCCI